MFAVCILSMKVVSGVQADVQEKVEVTLLSVSPMPAPSTNDDNDDEGVAIEKDSKRLSCQTSMN